MQYGLKKKLNFYSEDVWRKVFMSHKSVVFKNKEKKIIQRSSTIPYTFLGNDIKIYTGKKWIKKRINRWIVGFKFGEFTWNKKIALYKAKQLRKKK
jgi:ribosomal protein S19